MLGRERLLCWGAALAGLALAASPAPAAELVVDPGAPNWNGVWTRVGSINWDPNLPAGQIDHPDLTPEYQALYDKAIQGQKDGKPVNDPTAACVPPGMPRVMNMVYPMEIFQKPGQVAIFAEWQSQVRRVYTDGRGHPADMDLTYNGHSIGRWEGKELVVDTVGLRGDMMLTQNGLGLSDALHITERWKQTGPDTLTDTITLEDKKALRKPWTVVKTFKREPKMEIMEYVCQENNRNPILADGTTGVIMNKSLGKK